MTPYIIALIVLILAVAYWRNRHPKGYDIEVPEPVILRTDLLFGYYGCETGQADAVRDHTNLHWECQFNGVERAIEDILKMRCFTVLSVGTQMFEIFQKTGKNHRLQEHAYDYLYELFAALAKAGALQYVKAITPLDEPNTNCRTSGELLEACQIIRSCASHWLALEGVKLAVVYAQKPESFTCIEQFDLVAVCDPEGGSGILEGVYQKLLAAKRPDAKSMILPYGAFGQQPTSFINWAHTDGNVVAVVPFCWFGPREPADKWVGISAGPLREQYVAAGRALIGGAT